LGFVFAKRTTYFLIGGGLNTSSPVGGNNRIQNRCVIGRQQEFTNSRRRITGRRIDQIIHLPIMQRQTIGSPEPLDVIGRSEIPAVDHDFIRGSYDTDLQVVASSLEP